METYKFRDGYNWKIKPEVAAKELQKIEQNDKLTPEAVVNAAKDKNNPLHVCFDWNNKQAGERWRKHQARQLIGSIIVEIKINEPHDVRSYVNLNIKDEGQAYCNIHSVFEDDEKMQIIIDQAKAKLQAAAKQLAVFNKLQEVSKKIEQLVCEF